MNLLGNLLKKLQECIEKNTLNHSSVREVVLEEIASSEEALCSNELHKRANEKLQKKVSYNTVYRVLRQFEECGIVITIQSDIKKTHFCLTDERCNVYILDAFNNHVQKAKNSSFACELLTKLGLQNSKSFIVIHKK